MIYNNLHATPFWQFDLLAAQTDLLHFVSSRHGGVSRDNWSSLNMHFGLDDDHHVLENRRRLALAVGFSPDQYTVAQQVHGSEIAVVDQTNCGTGALTRDYIPAVDALISKYPACCLLSRSADCVPVLLYDPVKKVIAAIHAGWRSTAQFIVRKTVLRMVSEFGVQAHDIIAGIGPAIGSCCFEIGDDVAHQLKLAGLGANLIPKTDKLKYHFDLPSANLQQLIDVGVARESIEMSNKCTYCEYDQFFSYRHDGPVVGQLCSGIYLKPANWSI